MGDGWVGGGVSWVEIHVVGKWAPGAVAGAFG